MEAGWGGEGRRGESMRPGAMTSRSAVRPALQPPLPLLPPQRRHQPCQRPRRKHVRRRRACTQRRQLALHLVDRTLDRRRDPRKRRRRVRALVQLNYLLQDRNLALHKLLHRPNEQLETSGVQCPRRPRPRLH